MNKNTFGNKLKQLTDRSKFTQKAISYNAGINEGLYSKFSNDRRSPNTKDLHKISSVFGISIMNLLADVTHMLIDDKMVCITNTQDNIGETLQESENRKNYIETKSKYEEAKKNYEEAKNRLKNK